ncbi:glycosyltransferase family 2 protein [Janibacter melonis]|nr:glycosyltransferase family A protein [Janibacter melonis]
MTALLEVIITCPPQPGSDAARVLEALQVEHDDVVVTVLDDQFLAKVHPSTAVPSLISTNEAISQSQAVNLAAGESGSAMLLVVQGEFIPETALLADLVSRLREPDAGWWMALERRVDAGANVRAEVPSSMPGGAVLCDRQTFMLLRGLDESIDDADGLRDLVRRARAFGVPMRTAGGRTHSVTRFSASYEATKWSAPGARPADDKVAARTTVFANLREWSVRRDNRTPLVSVVIATRDRSQYLHDSLCSVLYQTFEDFEIIVVDDGSGDDSARRVVEALDDPRIRYFRQEPRGISAARNRAALESRGYFTAVHDDDDIMLPWRLEAGLLSMSEGVDATYGAWVNFDEVSGEMRAFLTKQGFGPSLNAFSGQGPGHGTWMLPTRLVLAHRYDENLTSSVDHNLASRLAWNGVRWSHCNKVLYLRRVHEGQISRTEASTQKAGHILTVFANALSAGPSDFQKLRDAGAELQYPKISSKDLFAQFGAWLPDNLVSRRAIVSGSVTHRLFELDMPPILNYILEERDAHTGKLRNEVGEIGEISLADLVKFRALGMYNLRLTATRRDPDEADVVTQVIPAEPALERLALVLRKRSPEQCCLVLRVPDGATSAPQFPGASASIRVSAATSLVGRVKLLGFFFDDDRAAVQALDRTRSEFPDFLAHLLTTGRAPVSLTNDGKDFGDAHHSDLG